MNTYNQETTYYQHIYKSLTISLICFIASILFLINSFFPKHFIVESEQLIKNLKDLVLVNKNLED